MIRKSQQINSPDFPAISEEDILINEWFIWSCTNGKYDDLKIAAKILKWRKIPENVSLVIVPASSEIYKKALKEGLIDIFVEAWALVESPNCAKCFGKHMWVAWPESRIISSSNRNYKWRMWSEKALIFLASPATVAASCLEWKITDPRKYLSD
jgi:3-isopropylmalate/(R)-2-methylmalate dehydratase large subunit